MLEVPWEHQFSNLTADGIVTARPAVLCCIILSVATTGDYIEIYEGRDATSGRRLCKIKALVGRSVTFNISNGVLLERGIYVSFLKTDSDATLIWFPVEPAAIREHKSQRKEQAV